LLIQANGHLSDLVPLAAWSRFVKLGDKIRKLLLGH